MTSLFGYFPSPYIDEIVPYSVIARYRYIMEFTSLDVNWLIYGNKYHHAYSELPNGIVDFINTLGQENIWKIDEIINNHTFFPVYSPFLAQEKAQEIRESMESNGSAVLHSAVGSSVTPVNLPKFLRFCPLCVNDDRSLYKETYWHRLHQIPGVFICPIHKTWLESSSFQLRDVKNNQYISAEEVIVDVEPRFIDENNETDRFLLMFSEECFSLLNQKIMSISSDALYQKYLSRLIELGYASITGAIHRKKLTDAFQKKYLPEFLTALGLAPRLYNFDWVISMLIHKDISVSPIKHFLVSNFLGIRFLDLLELPESYNPFGIGPWFCKNPFCEKNQKPVISECSIKVDQNDRRAIFGYFVCSCGYEYKETQPRFESDRENLSMRQLRTKVVKFGEVWERGFTNLWNDPRMTLAAIAKFIGTSITSVYGHAIRLNLQSPRRMTGEVKVVSSTSAEQKRGSSTSEKLNSYRSEWLTLLKDHPDWGIKQFQKSYNRICTWLFKNDPIWYKEHSPDRKKWIRKPNYDRWNEIDSSLHPKVYKSAQDIKSKTPPVRVTKNAIGKAIGKKRWICYCIDYLPLARKAIEEVSESSIEFKTRKLKWAEDLVKEKG